MLSPDKKHTAFIKNILGFLWLYAPSMSIRGFAYFILIGHRIGLLKHLRLTANFGMKAYPPLEGVFKYLIHNEISFSLRFRNDFEPRSL
jgi:hypothetical protein